MEDELENLILVDGEVEAFQDKESELEEDFKFYLVGSCLTDSVVHFSSLRNTLADFMVPYYGILSQIHDLPPSLISKAMTRQFCSFLGSFLDYDTKISMFVVKRYMRIKVRLDVRLPLKRKKKIVLGASWMENELKVNWSNDFKLMELGLDGKECPIQFVEGKKRQRMLGAISTDLFNGDVRVSGECQDRSASSTM
ncbi:hypothetical protein J1N35_011358 [Gossypium stocksii]|uniref:Uncharacterized protein n=1 Tax=Gossypium stocksii TaxID=47602 RepID=A0A9D3W4A9_9ROSI|nr:hypothetical protein J1N35_011358 [Gossypium stocksii]